MYKFNMYVYRCYESVKHFFLFRPRYAAQRNLLLTSAARILGETWSSSSDARKINFFLFGLKSVNYDINCTLFRELQTFIINTNRFSMATVWLFKTDSAQSSSNKCKNFLLKIYSRHINFLNAI